MFLKCPGALEVIAACGLGRGRLRGPRLTLGGEGGEGEAGQELRGPGLTSESLESGEAVKAGLQSPLGPGGQPLLGHRVHRQQVRADADGAELPRLLGLHVALVIRGVLGPDVIVMVGVVPQVSPAVPGGLGLGL